MIKLLGQDKKNQPTEEELNKQLNIQYAQIFKLIEDVREINQKIDKIYSLLNELSQKKLSTVVEQKELVIPSKKDKTKEAIKLILRKKGKMTSQELCKVIGLSRTRCNEYLKELEKDKEAKSEVINRKKYYKII